MLTITLNYIYLYSPQGQKTKANRSKTRGNYGQEHTHIVCANNTSVGFVSVAITNVADTVLIICVVLSLLTWISFSCASPKDSCVLTCHFFTQIPCNISSFHTDHTASDLLLKAFEMAQDMTSRMGTCIGVASMRQIASLFLSL